ncbi:Permuted papain-like amidase enzyme, YaeF/YiiX, C92 family [Cyclobacterium lianum]|uniref:Permuted papain-like amidase enzyme, YaeF/YiiX, C92 family n=1 Tax=Cyclobacterium lianum TaxID=388280 RepID=A0A1M7Q9J5_9BACT|nr:YiiX/YebB-like N1pC/P60 family cysteine hydrolase [Cyclobacterium lianum]SHN27132.1 Permuted papain-like amidase enzyme, YaeF/YiiX, C92 family [Cyclobacterium lianum]
MVKSWLNAGHLICLLLAVSCGEKKDNFEWKEGDILFQDGDCGTFCDAIRKVTTAYEGRHFSHNGLLVKENGEWMVMEAITKGVSLTPLDTFLYRHVTPSGNPKVHVGRIRRRHQALIPEAIEQGKQLLGKPYDMAFDMENDAFYCAELIHLIFKEANGGKGIFKTPPMTFKDPETGQLFPAWKEHFKNLSLPVPEGKPGLNPGGMTREPVIEMVLNLENP